MPETTRELPPRIANDPIVYQPLSGLALASLLLASAYALVMGILGTAAFVYKAPLFLGSWTLIIPIASACLAVAARWQIRSSEGTRSGMSLATTALWMSLLVGLGYMAISFSTFLAVWWQAERFTNEWFAKLQKNEINAAFLDTREPAKRQHDNPADLRQMRARWDSAGPGAVRGALTQFQESEIARIVSQGGPDTVIKPEGIKSYDYKEQGYVVQQSYKVSTPEGMYDIVLAVKSSQGKEFDGRKWQIMWPDQFKIDSKVLTPQGQALENWSFDSRRFADEWIRKLHQGQVVSAFLDTRQPSQREGLWQTYWSRLLLNEVGASAIFAERTPATSLSRLAPVINWDTGRDWYLPGYKEFREGILVNSDTFDAGQPMKAEIIRDVTEMFKHPSQFPARLSQNQARPRPVDKTRGTIQILEDMELGIFGKGSERGTMKYRCEAALVMESSPGGVSLDRKPQWQILSFDLLHAGPPPQDPMMRRPPGPSNVPEPSIPPEQAP